MTRSTLSAATASFALAAALLAGPAAAGTKDASAGPEMTTAVYGDWVLRCETRDATKLCEAATVVTPQGQTAPVAQLVIARGAEGAPARAAVLLPANVSFAPEPQLTLGKDGKALVSFGWVRCTPQACVAAADIPEEAVAGMSAATEPGRVVFHDSTGRQINIVISFRGVTQAVAALNAP